MQVFVADLAAPHKDVNVPPNSVHVGVCALQLLALLAAAFHCALLPQAQGASTNICFACEEMAQWAHGPMTRTNVCVKTSSWNAAVAESASWHPSPASHDTTAYSHICCTGSIVAMADDATSLRCYKPENNTHPRWFFVSACFGLSLPCTDLAAVDACVPGVLPEALPGAESRSSVCCFFCCNCSMTTSTKGVE